MPSQKTGSVAAKNQSSSKAAKARPNKKGKSATKGEGAKPTLEVVSIALGSLSPHPKYNEIYGADDSIEDIAETIEKDAIEPLKVVAVQGTPDAYRIISGHRRFRAAKENGFQTLPCIILKGLSDDEEVFEVLKANQYRQKTNLQKVREAIAWYDHEESLSKSRQGTRTDLANGDIMENRPGSSKTEHGATRDRVAERVGFGCGKTFDTAKKVVHQIDDLTADDKIENNLLKAQGLAKLLNKSVNAAHRAVKWIKENGGRKADLCHQLLQYVGADLAKDFNDAYVVYLKNRFEAVPAGLPSAGLRYTLDCGDIVAMIEKYAEQIRQAQARAIVVDIPYTSQPYGDANGDTWEAATHKVAKFAVEHLHNGESLFVMTGQYHLLEVGAILQSYPDLSYYWHYTVHMPGKSTKPAKRLVSVQTKSILHFVKGQAADGCGSAIEGRIICDLIKSKPLEKEARLHEWQQPEEPFIPILEHFTFKGDLIIDPMMATGTTGAVAMKQQKCFLGFDIDPKVFEIAKERLNRLAGELEATERMPPSSSLDMAASEEVNSAAA